MSTEQDLNQCFYASSNESHNIDTISTASSCSSDFDFEKYILTNSPEVLRCTGESFKGVFYNRDYLDESDQYSLIEQPIETTSSESSIVYHEFCHTKSSSEVIKDTLETNDSTEVTDQQSTLKVTCKSICKQIMKPIANKILNKFKRKEAYNVGSVSGKSVSKVVLPSDQNIIAAGAIGSRSPVKIYTNCRHEKIVLSCDAYRGEPDQLNESDLEKIHSKFNQCGDIVYYYV